MSSVKYTPGNEPQELKLKLQRFFEKVNAAYPDKVLCYFYRDHKKWGETLTKLRRELGYDDNTAFWEAYGYKVEVVVQGATAPKSADDYQVVIDELKKRYEGRTCPAMNRLSIENPDLSGKIKTLQNKAPTVFGMTLKEKLVSEGVLAETPRAQSSIEVPQKTQEERFEEIIQTLKDRYVNSEEKPSSLAELKAINRDISLGPQLFSYIKNTYGKKSEEYFAEIGVVFNEKTALKNITQGICKRVSSGCSENNDFDISPRGILRKYNGHSKVMIIPDGVKKIDPKVFGVGWEAREKAKFIEEVIIPDSVEIIDAQVFRDLTRLKKVRLSRNLRIIEEALFCDCTALCEVEIPVGVEVIEELAFARCTSLKKVFIPYTVKKIGRGAWQGAESIDEFIVDKQNKNYKSIDGVLYNTLQTELIAYPVAKENTKFLVPDSVEKVWEYAFDKCRYLESVSIPPSVKVITNWTFSCCQQLKEVIVSDETIIDSHAFYKTHSLAQNGFVIINNVMYECLLNNLSKLHIPDGVKIIKGFGVAFNCKNLYVPDSVEYIYNLPGKVEYISIPNTLKNIDKLKNLTYSLMRVFVRPDKNNDLYKKYYITPELKDFNGKGVLLDIEDENIKSAVRAILRYFNASIKKVMSKNVDYVITEDAVAYNKQRKHSGIIEASLENVNKTGVPMLVLCDEVINANDEYFNQLFVSTSKEEKFGYALSLYDTCVNKVQTMLDNVGTYGDPICSGITDIREKIHPNAEVSDADDFLNEIAKVNESWGDPHEEIAESYRYMYEKSFSENGYDLAECVGIEAVIAIAVACFVFGSPDCNIHIEWVRDKWESRGDYSSSFNVGFELSKTFADGRVMRCDK